VKQSASRVRVYRRAGRREDFSVRDESKTANGWTLGLSLRAPRATWLATLALALYYVAGMARDLSLYDSGELALAAVQLGLAHPPGQPLHTLLGFALSRLPLLPPLFGVNLLSALPGALTLVPATSLGQRLLGLDAAPIARSAMPWLLAACALHPCVWEPATRVEVYALATFGAVWSLAAAADLEPKHAFRSLRLQALRLGVALGLTASVNPVIALATGLAIVPKLGQVLVAIATGQVTGASDERRGSDVGARSARAIALCVLGGGLIGLLPYAYVPLVAGRADVMVWGRPYDLPSYLQYFLLRDYAHNQAITLGSWTGHLRDWLEWAGTVGLWPVLALGWIGHGMFGGPGAGRISVPLVSLLLLANIASNVVWDVDVPDYNGYMATALWALAAGAIAIGLRSHRRASLRNGLLAISLGCVVSAVATAPSPLARTRSRDHLARELATRVLREAPTGAIVISETDAVTGALFYLQGAERARPDVSVLAYGLASSSWHWEQLFRAHPDLRAIALQGSGGRGGRVRRLLEANPAKPVIVERYQTGAELGLRLCAGGLFLRAGTTCLDRRRQDPEVAKLLAAQLAALGEGSPSVIGAIAQTTYELGEANWRLGDPENAHALLLAGVPKQAWPSRTLNQGFEQAASPPPFAAGVSYLQHAALGDPGRNLFLASAIVTAAGRPELAREYLQAAAATGLPEAAHVLASR
jgi:hypothetical protein